MIRSNFRGTREISGDFRAQTAANRLGAQRIEALVTQYGAATLAHYLDELLRYTERRTRAAFAEFPDGRFAADMLMDGDGVTDQPVKLAATVTIERGPPVRRPHRLRRPAQIAHERDVVADLLGRGVRAQVPHRSGHPGERRLLPAHRHPEPPRLGGPCAASRRGGRGLGDRHAALRSRCSRRWPPRCPIAWWRARRAACAISRSAESIRRPASTSPTTRPSRAATGPRSPPTAWTRCRRTSRTPRTRRSRRPRPTTRCASCATRSSRTRRAAGATAAASACGATTRSPATSRASRFSPTRPSTRRGGSSAAARPGPPSTS